MSLSWGCEDTSRSYDIGPLLLGSADKCEKYDGEREGEGPSQHCWVTLENCQRAAADWEKVMRRVGNAYLLKCG